MSAFKCAVCNRTKIEGGNVPELGLTCAECLASSLDAERADAVASRATAYRYRVEADALTIELADMKARLLIQRVNDLSEGYRDGAEWMRARAAGCVLLRPLDDDNASIAAEIRALSVLGDAE